MSTILSASGERPWGPWLRWSLSFIGFPLAGLAARAAAGPIDGPAAAVVGGLAAGAVLGSVQAVALPGSMNRRLAWAAASAIGVGGGLALGAGVVDYQTDVPSLIVMGALTGAVVGVAQASVADMGPARRTAWVIATPALWSLGWLITSQVIVDAERQHAMFGSSGAIAVAALSGLVLTLGATRKTQLGTFSNTPFSNTESKAVPS